jgi:hypothetical protein
MTGETKKKDTETKRMEYHLATLSFFHPNNTGPRVRGPIVKEIKNACDNNGNFRINDDYQGRVFNVRYCASGQTPISMNFAEFDASGRKEVLVETRTYEFTDDKSRFLKDNKGGQK